MGFTTDRQEPGVEVDRWWLRMMSLACLLSIALHFAVFTTVFPIMDEIELSQFRFLDLMSVGSFWFLAGPVPYLHILLGLRRNPPTRALMLGVIWGSLMAAFVLLFLPVLGVTEETGSLAVLFGLSQMVTDQAGLLVVLFGLSQIVFVSIAIKTYCHTRMESSTLGNIIRGALTTVPYLGILFVGAIVIPKWIGMIPARNEASAIGSVRHLVASQQSYSETIGDGTYADSLDLLYSSNLTDSVLASGTKDGYTFIVSASAGNASFDVYARPITYYGTGTGSFFSDETGVIRFTVEDRPAKADDTPLTFGQ